MYAQAWQPRRRNLWSSLPPHPAELARPGEARPTVAKVHAAIERLKRGGILAKSSAGGRVIEDCLFQDFLAGLRIEQLD